MTAATDPAPLRRVLLARLVALAIAVTGINIGMVWLYYGTDAEVLEAEVIVIEMARLEAALLSGGIGPEERAVYDRHPGAYAFAVLDGDGAVLDAVNPHLIPEPARATGMFADDWIARRPGPLGPRVFASHVVTGLEGERRVVFAMIDDPAGLMNRALWREVVGHVWLPTIPAVLLLIGAAALTIRQALNPLARAAAWARSVQPGRAPAPLASEGLPAEIAALAEAVWRLHGRLDAALATERRRAAEAAHALRTPLAVLVARADALPDQALAQAFRQDLTALSRMLAQVLDAGRADSLPTDEIGPVDLAALAEGVVTRLAPFAVSRGVALGLETVAPLPARGADSRIELALSNLVENAILHGGAQVTVVVGPGPTVTVLDDGPGLPGGAQVFEPFWRGPGAPPGGAGLGMAIVARVAAAHDARLETDRGPTGGARIALHFPAA